MRKFLLPKVINSDNHEKVLHEILLFWEQNPNDPVELDASQLEYISSAGLRSILTFSKKQSDLSISNVNREVYEIFDVTGFVSIMKISRALKTFDVSPYPVIARGGTGVIYRISDDTVMKVYPETYSFDMIENERGHSRAALINGVPTAIPQETVKVGNGFGVFYEMMNADTLSKAFMEHPEKFDELIDMYVGLLENLQSEPINDIGLYEETKHQLREGVKRLYQYIPADEADKISKMVEEMSDEKFFVHGDLHPGNIMVHNGTLMLIDMADVTVGPKNYDIIAIYRDLFGSFTFGIPEADEVMCGTIGLPKEMIAKIWNAFVRKYYKTDDDNEIKAIQTKLHYNYALSAVLALMGLASEMLDVCFDGYYALFSNILFGEHEAEASAAIKELLG